MIINKIKQNLINIPGFRTSRKIVVFESDDWGSIRMRSKKDYDFFLNKGFKVDQCSYNKYDALESDNDFEELFETLCKFKDKNNNCPIFTLNNIVGNPDFDKIKDNNFEKYYFESFLKTLKKYPNRSNVYSLYKEGIEQELIKPQFHGREHLNVQRWLKAVKNLESNVYTAYDREMFTVYHSGSISGRNNYLDTFGLGDPESLKSYKDSLKQGLKLFSDIWGFNSESFIAPTYVWPVEIEKSLFNLGVKYIQGTHVQRVPRINHESGFNKKYHYLGQKNKFNQIYLIRNAFFEPSSREDIDWVNSCLSDIERSFKWRKPAIISTHRVNYIGSIQKLNRGKNLKLLEKLLKQIILKYPSVEFLSTDELGNLIDQNDR